MGTVKRIGWRRGEPEGALVTREWLLCNGLGGYACGSLGGVTTRRSHGLLIASLAAPYGRTIVLNRLDAELVLADGDVVSLEGRELVGGTRSLPSALAEVSFEGGLPSWRFEVRGSVIEKRIVMVHEKNTTCVTWRLLSSSAPVTLRLRPALHVRQHGENLGTDPNVRYATKATSDGCVIALGGDLPALNLRFVGRPVRTTLDGQTTPELLYAEEKSRGVRLPGASLSGRAFSTSSSLPARTSL